MPIDNPITSALDLLRSSSPIPITTPQGRLSLSPTAVIANITNAQIVHYLPYEGSIIPLWDRDMDRWVYRQIPDAGVSHNIGNANPGIFDIYAGLNSSAAGFFTATQGWSSATARFRPLTRKDGIWVLDFGGDDYRLYLGTVQTTGAAGSARMQDDLNQRLLFNGWNQIPRRVQRFDPALSWQYAGASWRNQNNSAANRINIVDGFGTAMLDLTLSSRAAAPAGSIAESGMGWDASPTPSEGYNASFPGDLTLSTRIARRFGSPGAHFVQICERVSGGGTVTFYGNYLGLQGLYFC